MTRAGIGLRLVLVAALFAVLVPLHIVALRLGPAFAGRLPVLLHRAILGLFGVRVIVRGDVPGPGAMLILANHVAMLDIPVISSLAPVSFVAKREIAGWPLIGWAARLQRSVFLDRDRKAGAVDANREIAARLAAGEAVVLFPEGTTGDGRRLLPFRSAIVGAARQALVASGLPQVRLQPLALAYVRRHGLPVGRGERPEIAWSGSMELAAHLSNLARRGPLDVVVTWGEPIAFTPDADRKAATALAERRVRAGVESARQVVVGRV